jgi:hypothetical protein
MRVALSVATKDSPPQRAGELPPLQIQFRNVANDEMTLTNLRLSKIDINGIWFGPVSNGNIQGSMKISPGALSANLQLANPTALYELNDVGSPVPNCLLQLRPGRYTIRVGISGMFAGFSLNEVLLESNPITIDFSGALSKPQSWTVSPPDVCAPRA